MKTASLNIELEKTIDGFVQLIASFTPEQLNTIPFEGSWTIAQVAEHVYKSNSSIIQALTTEGVISARQPDIRAKELKDTFLDFDTKFQTVKFLTPTEPVYEKEVLLTRLRESINRIKELSSTANTSELITHNLLGDITKLELLHFVVYHTQRHDRQVKNIAKHL